MKHKDNANSYITALILISSFLVFTASSVHAFNAGITGYSGNPNHNNGDICTSCHSGGVAPLLVINGSVNALVGSSNSFTVTLSGGQQNIAGFNLSASDGQLVDTNTTGTKTHPSGEISHSQAITVGTNPREWTFDWVAPSTPGVVTLYAAALSADGDSTPMGDNAVAATLSVTVAFDNTTAQVPVAKAGGPYVGSVNTSVPFDGSASFDLDGNIVRYLWDFGDNSEFVEGVNPTHTYTNVGDYTVTLAVTDNDGLTGAIADTVTIGTGLPPIANAGGPYNGTVGSAIQFDASASSDPDGTIVSYNWDFGDGNSGTGLNPTYTYTAEGTFDVTLTITDNDNWVATTATTSTIVAAGTGVGEQLYNQNCASCHGNGGAGGSAIAVVGASATLISNAIANIGSMGGINLTNAEIQLISEYLNGGGGASKPTDGPGLYAAYCASCHGSNGSGGPDGSVTGASESKINDAINKEAQMQSLGNLLTSQEIRLIADFLNGNSNHGD